MEEKMQAKINKLGFIHEEGFDIKGRLSISDFIPKSKKRCGIYLIEFSDETFYIGQAIDVVRRFSQHRKNYENMISLWFLPVKKELLNEVERSHIHQAEENGFTLLNKVHISNITGETDLDFIISIPKQVEWLEQNKQMENKDYDLYNNIGKQHILKYRSNFNELSNIEIYPQLKRILKHYISNFLPAHKKTEMSFWSLSCLPNTNKSTYPRYFCLNINGMEVFVCGYDKENNLPFCFMITSKFFLQDLKEKNRIIRDYGIEIRESKYRTAGNNQICIAFDCFEEYERLVSFEPNIVKSIKEMNLRLMKKGGTIFSKFHCFDLVKDVLMENHSFVHGMILD